MTRGEVIEELTVQHAENMTPTQLMKLCYRLALEAPMTMIVETLETYLWDTIDEVDYTHTLQEYPV